MDKLSFPHVCLSEAYYQVQFKKMFVFFSQSHSDTSVSKTAPYTSYWVSFLIQLGLVPRNKWGLENPFTRGVCFPWHSLASACSQTHPWPLWAPSTAIKSKPRERIQPRSLPLVMGEKRDVCICAA